MTRTFSLLVLFNVVTYLNSAKILVVQPTPSFSHQIVYRPLTRELARRGHEVTVITTDPAYPKGQSPANLTEIDVHDISYTAWENELRRIAIGKGNDMMAQLTMLTILVAAIFKVQVQSKELQGVLKENYDLLFIEACVRPALIFSHIHKAPVILISSFGGIMGTNSLIGTPDHPLLYPASFRQRIYNLTVWEKVRETYNQVAFDLMYKSYEPAEDEMLRTIFGPNIPKIRELNNNIDMFFLNVFPIWIDNQPMPPSVITVGGLHHVPERELPKVPNVIY